MAESLLRVAPPDWEVEQVVVLDWYDGPREGFCRLRFPAAEFHFKVVAERPAEDDVDDRVFAVATLPAGAMQELLPYLSFAGEPSKPVWIPRWQSSDEDEIRSANRAVEAMIHSATATGLLVRSPDFVRFLGVWARSP